MPTGKGAFWCNQPQMAPAETRQEDEKMVQSMEGRIRIKVK